VIALAQTRSCDVPAQSRSTDQRSSDLEIIARNAGPLRRIAARLPTYLADLRVNPAWLPMFLFARAMPVRRAHWRGAKPVPPSTIDHGRTMFDGVERRAVVDEL